MNIFKNNSSILRDVGRILAVLLVSTPSFAKEPNRALGDDSLQRPASIVGKVIGKITKRAFTADPGAVVGGMENYLDIQRIMLAMTELQMQLQNEGSQGDEYLEKLYGKPLLDANRHPIPGSMIVPVDLQERQWTGVLFRVKAGYACQRLPFYRDYQLYQMFGAGGIIVSECKKAEVVVFPIF